MRNEDKDPRLPSDPGDASPEPSPFEQPEFGMGEAPTLDGHDLEPVPVEDTDLETVDAVTPETDQRYCFLDRRLLTENGERIKTPDVATAELARGGMGRVLVAFDQHLGREIAVKELLQSERPKQEPPSEGQSSAGTPDTPMALSGKVVARFLREARLTGQLEHPSIVPVYELGARSNGSLYYAMKLVRGQTLHQALRECTSFSERLRLMPHVVDLAQAIAYAHSRGVVNRDIKPQNIMVGEFGETVVLDWGLAKVLSKSSDEAGEQLQQLRHIESPDIQQTVAEFLGTPYYMSPEQAWGKLDEVREPSDVWSIGAVFFELLVGRPPFEGSTVLEIVRSVREKPVPEARLSNRKVPAELSAIAARCLQREPRERYQSAKEVAEDLEAYLTGGRVSAHGYSSWELLGKFARRNKALCATILVGMVLLLVASGFIWRNYTVAVKAERLAHQNATEARRLEAEATREASRARDAEEMARKREKDARSYLAEAFLEKSRLAMDADKPGRCLAHLAQALTAESRPLIAGKLVTQSLQGLVPYLEWSGPAPFLHPRWVAFSQDGSRIYGSSLTEFRVWHYPGGEAIRRFAFSTIANSQTVVDETHNIVVVGDVAGNVVVYDYRDGTELRRWKAHDGQIRDMLQPPGTQLLVTVGEVNAGDSSQVVAPARFWDFGSGDMVGQFPPDGREDFVSAVATSPDGQLLLLGVDGEGPYLLRRAANLQFEAAQNLDSLMVAHQEQTEQATKPPLLKSPPNGPYDSVLAAAFSTDSRQLAMLRRSGKFVLLDLEDKKLLSSFSLAPEDQRYLETIAHLEFSSDGTAGVASTDSFGNVLVFHSTTGEILARPISAALPVDRSLRWDGYIDSKRQGGLRSGLAFSPKGDFLLTAHPNRGMSLFAATDGKEVATLDGHSRPLRSVGFVRGEDKTISKGLHGEMAVWNGSTGRQVGWLTQPRNREVLAQLDTSPSPLICPPPSPYRPTDGTVQTLESPSKDYSAMVVDGHLSLADATTEGGPQDVFLDSPVRIVVWNRSGSMLAAGLANGQIALVSAAVGEPLGMIEAHSRCPDLLVFSPDGRSLISHEETSGIRRWALNCLSAGQCQLQNAEAIAIHPSPQNDSYLLLGRQGTIRLWSPTEAVVLAIPGNHSGPVWTATYLDGETLATGGQDGKILLHDLTDKAKPKVLHAGDAAIVQMESWATDSGMIALDAVGGIRSFDGSNVPLRVKNTSNAEHATSLALAPDKAAIATGGIDGNVTLRDPLELAVVRSVDGHGRRVRSIEYSPDGKLIATAGMDGLVHFWHSDELSHHKTINVSSQGVWSVLFHPNAAYIFTAGSDGQIRMWNLSDGTLATVVGFHNDLVNSLQFAPKSRALLSASADNSVRIWPADLLDQPIEGWPEMVMSRSGFLEKGIELRPVIYNSLPSLKPLRMRQD